MITEKPPTAYRKRFLQFLIDEIERRSLLPIEELWCLRSDVSQEKDEPGFRTLFLSEQPEHITISHQPYVLSGGTTGLATWDAAFFMVEWIMAHNKDCLRQKRVLELGAGSGLTGITLLKIAEPKFYTFTDCHVDVLQKLRDNLELNKCRKSVYAVETLDWTCLEETEKCCEEYLPQIILACDIAYDPDLMEAFFQVLEIFRRKSKHCLDIFIALKIRNENTFAFFLESATKKDFTVNDEITNGLEFKIFPKKSYDPSRCRIFSLRSKLRHLSTSPLRGSDCLVERDSSRVSSLNLHS